MTPDYPRLTTLYRSFAEAYPGSPFKSGGSLIKSAGFLLKSCCFRLSFRGARLSRTGSHLTCGGISLTCGDIPRICGCIPPHVAVGRRFFLLTEYRLWAIIFFMVAYPD